MLDIKSIKFYYMKNNMKIKLNKILKVNLLIAMAVSFGIITSCEEEIYPEAGSIADKTPPQANFTASQLEGPDDTWKSVKFSNKSSSATDFSWNFGNGKSSTEFEPTTSYPDEGTYTISLTASDKNGVSNTYSSDFTVTKPPAPLVEDPVLVNPDFVKQAKSSGSDCTCSGWINKSLGDQGESSSGNGSDVLKFDNNEPDHIYQEFAVTPNANYEITVVVQFKPSAGKDYPASLEFRMLAGTGYDSGYTPTYYTDPVAFPQDGFGYSSIAQVEDTSNNLMVEVLDNPGDDSYLTYKFKFESGANDSAALFVRGIGGAASGKFGYNSGDEEIRLDNVIIEAIN